jgi:hypothetical protein
MSNNIVSNFGDFSFDSLTLAQPHAIQGGTYFTRLTNNGNGLYIQTPKCQTKQGITKTEHKIYTDLIFSQDNSEFIEWLESLEGKLQKLVYEKRTTWFHNDLELEDIETAFTPLTRTYKSGKNYLVRCNLGKNNNTGLKHEIKIFNESEKDLELGEIKPTDSMITIVEISGIRFSSRSFHVDLYIKQLMVFQNDSPFNACMIKHMLDKPSNDAADKKGLGDTSCDNETISSLSELDSHSDEDETEINLAADTELDEQLLESEKKSEVSLDNEVIEEKKHAEDKRTVFKETVAVHNIIEPAELQNKSLGNMNKESNIPNKSLDKTMQKNVKDLEEVELTFDTVDDEIKLKDPNEVYMQIYVEARQKAKMAKKVAIEAYLEAKKIKNTYLLEEIDESDEEDMLGFSEN